MIGKFILPWFGGTPAVWSTVILFFQVLLTAGYAYASWLIERCAPTRQRRVHISLLVLAAALLIGLGIAWPSPIMPPPALKPAGIDSPILHIFLLLLISVGLPYFMLASNGPLMQAWYSRLFPERSYARLYALSNAGSLLGLLAYPFVVEPSLTLRTQGWAWAIGFGIFAILAARIATRAVGVVQPALHALSSDRVKPTWASLVLWMILSGTASLLLLSVTNQISQEVAVIPFLWIVPLTLYLLTFILAFSDARWYERRLYALLFILAGVAMLWVLTHAERMDVLVQIGVYSLLLFLGCMICHAELFRLRPPAQDLTTFYLMVSVGGALGGIFVNLVAPIIFTGYWEFYLAWLLTIAVLVGVLLPHFRKQPRRWAGALFITFAAATLLLALGLNHRADVLYVRRNFYGVLRVKEWLSPNGPARGYAMIHGITIHGIQYRAPENPDQPTTYYVVDGGGGLALLNHPRRGQGMRVGVLGLGAGTLAVYGLPGDSYRFYEINPVVVDLAAGQGGYFSFLQDSRASVSVILGDARISLERELEAAPEGQRFDVLILDTFSSDSIPVHLVTREAFALYLQHLAPDGILAAHISNRHLDLQPVLWQLAQDLDLAIVRVDRPARAGDDAFPSEWILMSRDPEMLSVPGIQAHATSLSGYSTDLPEWTDDYSNLFQILK